MPSSIEHSAAFNVSLLNLWPPTLPPLGRSFLESVLQAKLLDPASLREFFQQFGSSVEQLTTHELMGEALRAAGLLTDFQLGRILNGQTHGLILGNYRVLDRIGGGTVGVVFLGEHRMLRRRVAIKVLPVDETVPAEVLERFHAEMRLMGQLNHPNIVMAYDAGILPASSGGAALHYLVMELVPGGDLENFVYRNNAPLPIAQACEIIRQAAAGLQVAHDHHLIHRDLKPSNILLTEQLQVKLVDFGLARQLTSTLTQPKMLLGSLEFMAPEQSLDPTSVGVPADIYGLGATLFWILTGQTPFEPTQHLSQMVRQLQTGQPRRMRDFRPEIPEELDEFVDRMLDRDPDRRPALAITVMNALAKFAAPAAKPTEIQAMAVQNTDLALPEPLRLTELGDPAYMGEPSTWRIIVADTDPDIREFAREALTVMGCTCRETIDTAGLHQLLQEEPADLLILEHDLPGSDKFYKLTRKLRERPPTPNVKIVVLSHQTDSRDLAEALANGADDLLPRPVDPLHLAARVQHLLRLKDAQDRSMKLAEHLITVNRQLEESLQARASDVRKAQDALLFAMAKMAESRQGETSGHLRRLQKYSLFIAEQLKAYPGWSEVIDRTFLDNLERCVPLHDIGKIGLPSELLSKPGPFTPAERKLMETHTTIGVDILEAIGREYGDAFSFLGMARAIVKHHHEHFDGSGYPDKLVGEAIPEAARIVALADVYDALRRKLAYKPAMDHTSAATTIIREMKAQFDPMVLKVFATHHVQFDKIYQSIPN